MDNSAIQTLEAAAQVLMAPPNLVTSEQRHHAESVFLEFRRTKNPYALCREILEKSVSEYVLFEAAGLMKTSLIREWTLLSEGDISSLKEYLLNYLLRKESPPFLREKLLQTIAIIIKRGSAVDGGRERQDLLTELEKIILSSPIDQQRLACSLILAIMQEFAITVNSADVGMVWEIHFRLKKSFEAVDLIRIFRFTVGILEQIVRSGHRPEGEQALLTKQLLTIVEMILCWGHRTPLFSKRLTGTFEAIFETYTPALRLGHNWKDTIMQPELIALFFEVFLYVRSNPELANPSLTCLVQLASVRGVVLFGPLKQQYLDNFVNSFLNVIPFIQPAEREMLGIAEIYRNLIRFFRPNMIANTPLAFLENLTRLTCHAIRGAIIEEGINNDTILREALSTFLHTWSSIVLDSDGYSNETLMNPCIEVFNTYLQCRLAPPDGTRGTESSDGCADDIKDDIEEDERKMYENDLYTIGAMGRKAPAHCSHVLFTLLQDRSKKLEGQLQLMHMGKLPVSGGEQLISLFEDLHWILMITGHFIAIDCTVGETESIPPEILQYSREENANVDASLRYFMGESTSTENVDSVLKIMGEILRISAYECAALEAGLGTVFSPEVSATISWLLKIWSNSYLMLSPDVCTEMPVGLCAAFGCGSPYVRWATARLCARVACVLRHAHTQPAPATHALQLLATMAQGHHKENPLATCEEFLALVAWEAAGSNLSGAQRRELHRAFAMVATYAEGESRRRLLSSTVALQEKLMNILNLDTDTEPVRNMLADTLDCYIGISEGVYEVDAMDEHYIIIISALEKIPSIVFKYHNYPGVVLPCLQLLHKSTRKMLNSVQPQHVTKLLEICNTTFDVYMRWNQGKISAIPEDAEEEAYEDICTLMELISGIARCGADKNVDETCSKGLRMLLPMVTPSLLSLPTLAHNMYKMIRDMNSFGIDQLTNLPMELFGMVVEALRVGVSCISGDVSVLSCESIGACATKLVTRPDSEHAAALLPLMPLLLHLSIRAQLSEDTIPEAAGAIYSLACLKPDLMLQVMPQLVSDQPSLLPRLQSAIDVLNNGIAFTNNRGNKKRFRDNFDKFLATVQGFLVVK